MTKFFQGEGAWNDAYNDGTWDYLSADPSELSRQALVAAQISIHGVGGRHSVLDLGCGEGVLGRFISQDDDYQGVDISTDVVEKASRLNPNRKFLAGNIGSAALGEELLEGDKQYDTIVLNEVMYYLSKAETRALTGFLVTATKQWNNPLVLASICRTDIQTINHSSYYWSELFENLQYKASLEIADQKHRWDIKAFQGERALAESPQY